MAVGTRARADRQEHWWQQLHLVYMLHDGRIFDPHYGEVDVAFYWRVHSIIGLYKVEPRPTDR